MLESESVTMGLGLLALRLQALLERGCTAAEAEAAMARLSDDHRVVFSLETLEYLQRGGRIGRAQAVAGSLLRVRPILQFDDGEVAPYSRVRGAHRVMPAMREFIEQHSDPARPLRVALRPHPPARDHRRARGRWSARPTPAPASTWSPRSGRPSAPTPARGRTRSRSSTTRWSEG